MKHRSGSCKALLAYLRLIAMGLCVVLTANPLRAQPSSDSQRIASVEVQINTVNELRQKAGSNSEKAKLETKLQRLRDELAILHQRQVLDRRVKALTEDRLSNPLDALREKLRLVDASEDNAKKQIEALGQARRAAAAERDALAGQIMVLQAEAKAKGVEASNTELEERLYTRNEEVRSLSMQREASENEVELAHEAERLREDIKNLEHTPRANLRNLLEARENVETATKQEERLNRRLAEQQQGLHMGESGLKLARQKLAMFDEELALLEKQTGFFKSDARVEKLLQQQRAQKKAVLERLPHLEAQVGAAQLARKNLALELELIATEKALRDQRLAELSEAYVERLRWPVYGLSGLFAVYLIFNYIVVRLAFRRSNRPLARRLVRYGSLLAAVAIVAGFLFDDLSMFAATLGIVSAALVISLQDVCASVFGWFVIMIAGKFRVGDRLEIDTARGDIIDIDMLTTTVNEINGWLGTDEPTGRVVTIPNNFIFKSKVINYNHQHPYIWSRLDLTITFESPLAKTLELFGTALREATHTDFEAARKACQDFREHYGTEDAHYEPRIHTQIVDTGILLSLYYVAHYRESCAARTRINAELMRVINANPSIQLSNPTINLVHTNATPPSPVREPKSPPSRHPGGPLDPILIPSK